MTFLRNKLVHIGSTRLYLVTSFIKKLSTFLCYFYIKNLEKRLRISHKKACIVLTLFNSYIAEPKSSC